jgi:hypothetical protein
MERMINITIHRRLKDPTSLSLSLSPSSHCSIMSTATDSSRNGSNSINNYKHAAPIPILTSRRRLSTSSDGSPISPPTVQTPNSFYPTNLAPSSPTGSSFFSQLISTSPKTSASFPYKRPSGFGAPPVFEGKYQSSFCCYSLDHLGAGLNRPLADDEGQEMEARSNSLHQRRATTAWAGTSRTAPQPQPGATAPPAPPVIEAQHARGAGVLRRLSLGGGLNSVRTSTQSSKSFFADQYLFT